MNVSDLAKIISIGSEIHVITPWSGGIGILSEIQGNLIVISPIPDNDARVDRTLYYEHTVVIDVKDIQMIFIL